MFIGYLLALSSAVTALTQLVGGYVADAWGRRKVVAVFSFLSAASASVFIFTSQDTLLILPVVLGSIAGIYGPAFNAMLTDSMESDLRARGLVSFTLVTKLHISPYARQRLFRLSSQKAPEPSQIPLTHFQTTLAHAQ